MKRQSLKTDVQLFFLFSCRAIMTSLSEFTRGRIVGLWEAGVSEDEIAQRIQCNVRTVHRWINRWQEEGEEGLKDKRKNNHRERFTTAEQNVSLVRQVDENPFLPVLHSVNLLDLQISVRTAQRRLHEANVHCYQPARKIPLTNRHREDRVAFALHQLNTASPEDWDRTIWTDEKVFCSADDRYKFVWRPENHRLDPKYVVPSGKSGRITCGMWGWISAHCPGELIEVSPHMDALEYIDILENVLLPSVRKIYSKDDMPTFRLVQDNSAVHTAHVVQEWFAQHPEIEVLDWPAKSPDLNLIENVWAAITNSWEAGHERNKAQLIVHAKTAWENLRQRPQLFANLRASIEKRLDQVIARNGWWTDY